MLLIIIGALVTLGVRKADAAFEQITRLEERQQEVIRRVSLIENSLGIYSPKTKPN